MNTFNLTIRTPEQEIFKGEATGIRFDAEGGQMKVLSNHASITSSLNFSPVIVETKDTSDEFIARQGIFHFDNDSNSGSLLCLYCEPKEELDEATAKDYLEFIEEQLAKKENLSKFQLVYLENEKVAVKKQLEV